VWWNVVAGGLVLVGLFHVLQPRLVQRIWVRLDQRLPAALRWADPRAFPAQARGWLAILLGVIVLVSPRV
jgi:hypothetical protein